MKHIVVLDGYTANPGDLSWKGLEQFGSLTVYDRTPPEQVVERAKDADLILLNKTLFTREHMLACPKLRYIGIIATGYNVVDIASARELGIVVTNIPAYSTTIVAQYTMALLLEICHHIGHHSEAVSHGRWTQCKDFCFWDYPVMELAGKTMGIIGFGQIGKAVSSLAQAFGMKVLVCTNHPEASLESERLRFAGLEELLRMSDVVSLHCPLTENNVGFLNRDTLALMKPSAILLNTARGPLVNEQDLADALNSGKLYAAGTDVASTEPIREDNPLLQAKNCIITPHIAWASMEARTRLLDMAAQNIQAFLDGSPIHVVNG